MLQVEFLALTKKMCIFAIVCWCKLKTFSGTTITRVKVFLSVKTKKNYILLKNTFFSPKNVVAIVANRSHFKNRFCGRKIDVFIRKKKSLHERCSKCLSLSLPEHQLTHFAFEGSSVRHIFGNWMRLRELNKELFLVTFVENQNDHNFV
jgi:hypothetical protein